eukprot:CAMPEP_0176457038 /NCGR_PEP_ID=MMETSP0127-20121128/31671_1 /TAXON_ID=938130 /ORGANISM="Platyophrya macrostoma, Strain WH" /LENGTH=444 /DNA_ID=CAMNT_0017847163 /DNA_START=197 /DNA_END=1531 /DNA_ORIENTATION=-
MVQQNSSTSSKRIVALRVKDKSSVYIDYWLTQPDTRLNYLPEKITLFPFYSTSLPKDSSLSLSYFEIIAFIGEGGFAKVYLVRSKIDGKFYAMKQLRKADSAAGMNNFRIYRERNILIQIKSPQVVKLHYVFQSEAFCYFVLDYVPCGTLLSLKNKVTQLSEFEAKFYVAEILLGLRDIHSRSIMCRDLKTENIILDVDGHIKLCDFGLAKQLDGSGPQKGGVCGTPQFISPEMAAGKEYDLRIDHYAVGVVAYELLVGKLPFADKDGIELRKKIIEKQPVIPETLTESARDFLARLLCKDPQQRLGAKGGVNEILSHSWFKGFSIEKLQSKALRSPIIREPMTKNLKNLPDKVNIEKWAENTEISDEKLASSRYLRQLSFIVPRESSFGSEEDEVLDAADLATKSKLEVGLGMNTKEEGATRQGNSSKTLFAVCKSKPKITSL